MLAKEALQFAGLIDGLREDCFIELAAVPKITAQLPPLGWLGPWRFTIRVGLTPVDEVYVGFGLSPLEAVKDAITKLPPGVVT
jgi:hypothetical protein